jgi:hypothetical protein
MSYFLAVLDKSMDKMVGSHNWLETWIMDGGHSCQKYRKSEHGLRRTLKSALLFGPFVLFPTGKVNRKSQFPYPSPHLTKQPFGRDSCMV